MTRRSPRALLVLAAVGLLVTACSDDDGGGERTESALETTTTNAEPASTTTEAATTTTTDPCPALEPAGDDAEPEAEVLEATADVDGDGIEDVVRSLDSSGDSWLLQADLGRGGGATLELDSFGGGVGVVGGADLDGDGAEEVWARTGTGASTTIVGLFAVDGCELARVELANGDPAELAVGGSVGTASGLECTGAGEVLAFTASYTGDGTTESYDVETVAYQLDGAVLTETDRTRSEVLASDPEFVRYTSFACGDLTL